LSVGGRCAERITCITQRNLLLRVVLLLACCMALPLGSEGSGAPDVKANTSPLRERKSGFCFEDRFLCYVSYRQCGVTYDILVFHSKKVTEMGSRDDHRLPVYVVLRGVSRHCLRREMIPGARLDGTALTPLSSLDVDRRGARCCSLVRRSLIRPSAASPS